jgi:hypothetical protein
MLHAQQVATSPAPGASAMQPPDAGQAPQEPATPPAAAKGPESRRDDIRMMESVLTQALQ